MPRKRKSYSKELKAKVALEALKEVKTLAQISSETGVHSNLIRSWKTQAKEFMAQAFERSRKPSERNDGEETIRSLYEKIGRLEMDLEWLKKKHTTLS